MYDMRYVRGRVLAENADSLTYSWIRDAPPRALDYASLTSICDAFFPRIFLRREWPTTCRRSAAGCR